MLLEAFTKLMKAAAALSLKMRVARERLLMKAVKKNRVNLKTQVRQTTTTIQ